MGDGLKCFMIAFGEPHQQMAQLTVPLVEKHTGLEVEVLVEGGESFDMKPFEMKLQILDRWSGSALFVDVDAVVRSWDWDLFDQQRFNAAQDHLAAGWLDEEFKPFFPMSRCFNSGVWFATQEHKSVFELARKILKDELKDHPYKLFDQTALNTALYRSQTDVNVLPREMNYLISPKDQEEGFPPIPEGVHVVHVCGNSLVPNVQRKLERLQQAVAELIA